jgi:X-X-X-Leu-X-X-Gly heptad repeat protein
MLNKAMSKKVISLVIISSMLCPTMVFAKDNINKDETVYVTMSENGNVKNELVSNWLHSDSLISGIRDKSTLSNIKNIKSKEIPEKTGDVLVWNTTKNDVFYQGDTKKNLPISFKITYFLNNNEINPKELVGKSGNIKIKIDIENKDRHVVKINGKDRTIYTPMTVATIATLPGDVFSNIKTNGGPIISVGNNQVVSFVSFPGMTESLGINDGEFGISLPSNLEITADITKFKMAPILMTASPKLPDVNTIKTANTLEDLRKGITDLKDGAAKLSAGLITAQNKTLGLSTELSKNTDKLSLITNNDNVNAERKLLQDSFIAMNMDTSMLNLIPAFITPKNMALINKTSVDLKSANLEALMKDPMLKNLLSLMTPSNIENASKLIADTANLSKVDMTKFDAMTSLLDNSTELKKLLTNASSLKSVDVTGMSTFLNMQITGVDDFKAKSQSINAPENVVALNTAIDIAYPIAGTAEEQKLNAELKLKIAKYSGLITKTSENMQLSKPYMEKTMVPTLAALNGIKTELIADTALIAEVQKALSDENVAYLKAVIPGLKAMQSDLANNQQNLTVIKGLLQKASDPTTLETISKIKVLEKDYIDAKPLLDGIQAQMTPELLSKLSKSPALVTQLITMQKDLSTNKKILDIVQDSLSENNVDRAKTLISALPSLTDGINQLAEGSKTLADGTLKLDSTVAPKLTDVKDILSVKDELIKLSENYKSFTGIGDDMKGTVKFVMKTDEIKVADAPQNKKVAVKEEKKGFWQWIKGLF